MTATVVMVDMEATTVVMVDMEASTAATAVSTVATAVTTDSLDGIPGAGALLFPGAWPQNGDLSLFDWPGRIVFIRRCDFSEIHPETPGYCRRHRP